MVSLERNGQSRTRANSDRSKLWEEQDWIRTGVIRAVARVEADLRRIQAHGKKKHDRVGEDSERRS